MKVVKLSQRADREAWLELRRGKIGGSTAKKNMPLSRGADRTPQGLWDLIGERLTKQPEFAEQPMDRGQRLEQEAVSKASKILDLPFSDDPGMWVSDKDENITVSPDAAEPIDKPSYSMEAKVLGAGKHFKYLFKARNKEASPIDLVPNEAGSFFKEQCLQYFVVNERLQDHYFVLYNEDCIFEQHEIVIIHIKRQDVADLITAQEEVEIQMLSIADDIVSQLVEGL